MNKTVSITMFVYLYFRCFFHIYGDGFGNDDAVREIIQQSFFIVDSLTFVGLSAFVFVRIKPIPLKLLAITMLVYNLVMVVFNTVVVLNLDKKHDLVNDSVLSGLSFFIIFVLSLIAFIYLVFFQKEKSYGGLDSRK